MLLAARVTRLNVDAFAPDGWTQNPVPAQFGVRVGVALRARLQCGDALIGEGLAGHEILLG